MLVVENHSTASLEPLTTSSRDNTIIVIVHGTLQDTQSLGSAMFIFNRTELICVFNLLLTPGHWYRIPVGHQCCYVFLQLLNNLKRIRDHIDTVNLRLAT